MPAKPKPDEPKARYRHLIGGEARGKRHEPGDRVHASTPPAKLKEWLKAGIIEAEGDANE